MARIRDSPWGVLGVLCAGFFMTLLDTSVVNVAIPAVRADLSADFDQILWVVNGYVLALAVLLIAAGRLGDRFGPKRLPSSPGSAWRRAGPGRYWPWPRSRRA